MNRMTVVKEDACQNISVQWVMVIVTMIIAALNLLQLDTTVLLKRFVKELPCPSGKNLLTFKPLSEKRQKRLHVLRKEWFVAMKKI